MLVSANVTSLNSQLEAVLTLPGSVLLLQETRLGEVGQRSMGARLRERGWQAAWGKPQPQLESSYNNSAWNVAAGGVAVLARRGLPLRLVPPHDDAERMLWETGRWCHATIPYGSGRHLLHLMSVYGYTGSGKPDENRRNDDLLRDVLAVASTLGDVPIVVAGDFNTQPDHSAILLAAYATGKWHDVAASVAAAAGVTPAATCYNRSDRSNGGTRIDYVLANSVAFTAVENLTLVQDSGVPTHLPLRLVLNLQPYAAQLLRVVRPLAYPIDHWAITLLVEDADSLAAACWAPCSSSWTACMHAPNGIEEMWALFCTAAERYLETRSKDLLDHPAARYRGRGRHHSPRRGAAVAPQRDGEPGALGQQQLRLLKLTRRVEEYLRSLPADGPFVMSYQLDQLWAHIRASATALLDSSNAWVAPLFQAEPAARGPATGALSGLRALCTALSEQTRRQRRSTWTAWVQCSWHTTPGRLYRYTKGEASVPATMLQRGDKSFTADFAEMDDLLRKAWSPIFALYRDSPEPAWEPFAERFGRYIIRVPMDLADLTAADLQSTLAKQSTRCAAGIEGWRVAELKALPPFLLDKLAQLLNQVEKTGRWPRSLERALVTLVPKGEGGHPLAMRPISVASAVYRLWAATRLRDAMRWQEGWAHPGQHGFRPKHGTLDVYWEMALRVEDALLSGTELAGILLDYAKCFDRLPHGIMLRLASESGAPDRLMAPIRSMYSHLRRRFKFCGGVGEVFQATNGILQGCPLSVVLLNLLVSVWARAVSAETDASPSAYADDTGALGSQDAVRDAGQITVAYCSLTGQQLNVDKSACFAVGAVEGAYSLILNGKRVPQVLSDRCLGAHLSFTTSQEPGDHITQRLRRALDAAHRIAALPLPLTARSRMLAAQPCAAAFYGTEVTQLTAGQQTKLAGAVLHVLWGSSRQRRCREIVLTLFAPGHLVDPQQALLYRRLVAFQRMVTLRPDVRGLLLRVRAHQGPAPLGPVGLILEALVHLQWTWGSPWTVTTSTTSFDLLTVPSAEWAHAVRHALRLRQWCAASERRPNDMTGVEMGIDREATSAGWQTANSFLVAGVIRSILAGAVWTQDRWHRSAPKTHSSATCPHCANGVPETLQHLWWECAAWDSIRRDHPDAVAARRPSWPCCLTSCGIMPVGLYDTPSEQTAVATAVQVMMASIKLAHSAQEQPSASRATRATATSSPSSGARPSGYPWGWSPPGPHDRFAVDLPALPVPRQMYGVCKSLHYVALCAYLPALEWPRMSLTAESRAAFNVTFAELAIDFELFSGLDLPAARRRAPGTAAPLVDRAQAFSSLLDLATTYAAPRALFGGVKKKRVFSLAPVGVHRSSGLSRRPILLCGAETERVLEQLLRSSHPGVPAAPGKTAALKGWWQTFTPTYPPDRVNRSAEWEALARPKPRAAALSRTPTFTLPSSPTCATSSLVPPSAASAAAPRPPPSCPPIASPPTDWTSTPSAIVPPGVDKRPRLGTRLAGLCELHGRSICETCRSATRQPLLRLCCRRHHSASDPRMADFCESHRRTPCARCQAIPSSADVCCGKGHHASPPPQTSPSPLESGQPARTSPQPAPPSSPRAPTPRPTRRRPAGPRVRPQPLRGAPSFAASSPPGSAPSAPLPFSATAAAALAAAAAAPRKRRPVAEATPPPPRKRRPPCTTGGAPQRRQPTLLQLLGKRERPSGAPEDAAPQVPKRPKPAHGHGRAEPEARKG